MAQTNGGAEFKKEDYPSRQTRSALLFNSRIHCDGVNTPSSPHTHTRTHTQLSGTDLCRSLTLTKIRRDRYEAARRRRDAGPRLAALKQLFGLELKRGSRCHLSPESGGKGEVGGQHLAASICSDVLLTEPH